MKIKCQDKFVVRFNPAVLDFIEGRAKETTRAIIDCRPQDTVLRKVSAIVRETDRILTGKANR